MSQGVVPGVRFGETKKMRIPHRIPFFIIAYQNTNSEYFM